MTDTRALGSMMAALLTLTLLLGAPTATRMRISGMGTDSHKVRSQDPPGPPRTRLLDGGNIQVVGHIGGRTHTVAVQGDTVYISEGPTLTILDVSNPASPAVVSKIPMLGVKDLVVIGNYAYVVGGGLWVVDVSDPARPTMMGSCEASGTDLAVIEGYAYALESRDYPETVDRVQVVDVSNPSNPTVVGSYDLPRPASDAVVIGDTVYVVGGYGLWVMDISDRARPTEVVFHDTWNGESIAAAGGYAYIVTRYRMLVVDVSDPVHPAEVESLGIRGYGHGVAVGGDYGYVASGSEGLEIVDISDPANLAKVGSYETPGYDEGWSLAGYTYEPDEAWGVAVSGDYAYVAAEHAGLRVVDVSDPANPAEVGTYDTPGATSGVAVTGDTAYVADRYDGLWVVDISDPAYPTGMGCCGASAHAVAASGNYAYVVTQRSRVGPLDVRVLDVSDPAHPAEVSSYEVPGLALGAAVAGSYLSISNGDGLLVLDISDPARLAEVGSYRAESGGVDVAGGYAYLVIRDSGLEVVDISDPANPIRLGAYDRVGMVGGVAVAGDYAYVATGYDLLVLDVSNPANPTEAGSYDLPEVGSYDHPEPAFAVAVVGDTAYVANKYEGLFILRLTESGAAWIPSPTPAPVPRPTSGPSPSPALEPTSTPQRGRGPCLGAALVLPLLLVSRISRRPLQISWRKRGGG